MVAQKSDDHAKVWWSYQKLRVTITPKSDGMLPIRALTVTSDEDGITIFLASCHDDCVCYSVLAIQIQPGRPDNQRIRFWQWKGKSRLYCPIPVQWFFIWNEVWKIKLNTKHPSLFTFCLVVLLLFILILFEIHKQQVNETNKLTGKFVDTWWKLTPWIKQFLFKSEIITKRAIYLIWKIFFKAKIKYLYSFILQNVPFCL